MKWIVQRKIVGEHIQMQLMKFSQYPSVRHSIGESFPFRAQFVVKLFCSGHQITLLLH